MGVSDDDNILFDDADSTFVATTIGAALEEFNDSINAGVPNGAGAKVHWSQLLGVPAGFADGTDDGGGGATAINDIGDATADGSVNQGAHEMEILSTIDAANEAILTIINGDDDAANDNAFIELRHDDVDDANVHYLRAYSDHDGTPTLVYDFAQDSALFNKLIEAFGGISMNNGVIDMDGGDVTNIGSMSFEDGTAQNAFVEQIGLGPTDNVAFASLQLGTGAGGGLTLLGSSAFSVGAGSSIDWNGNPINELGSLNRTFTDHNTPGATETIDVDSTSIDRVFLDSASCEITFDDAGIHAGTLYREKLVYFIQDGSGNRAVTYAVGSDPVGTDPSIDLTASSITIVRYWTFDDWTTIYAMGSGDVPNTVALKAGNTYTGTHDFGGATAVEIENGNDPDLTVEGEVSWDNNGDVLRGFDGTNQVAVGRKIEALHCTVILPNDMADSERDAFWMWSNESGMSFVVTGWKAWSDTDDTTLNIETILADGTSNATVDAVEIATNGTGLFSGADTTITAATIANGSLIVLDFDDTDTPGQVKITIYGYYDANVN